MMEESPIFPRQSEGGGDDEVGGKEETRLVRECVYRFFLKKERGECFVKLVMFPCPFPNSAGHVFLRQGEKKEMGYREGIEKAWKGVFCVVCPPLLRAHQGYC